MQPPTVLPPTPLFPAHGSGTPGNAAGRRPVSAACAAHGRRCVHGRRAARWAAPAASRGVWRIGLWGRPPTPPGTRPRRAATGAAPAPPGTRRVRCAMARVRPPVGQGTAVWHRRTAARATSHEPLVMGERPQAPRGHRGAPGGRSPGSRFSAKPLALAARGAPYGVRVPAHPCAVAVLAGAPRASRLARR